MSSTTAIHRILLLDDEPTVLNALRLLLGALGFSVQDFSSPEAAVAHLNEASSVATDTAQAVTLPDLVLSDLKMPKMNGHQVLAAVRAKHPRLPFVLMSAHATPEDVETAMQLGASGYLAKPFSPDQLFELLAKVAPAQPTP